MEFVHKSVLFDEAISALELNEQKIIADGTAGGGGHSREIAKTAKRLIAIDQDPDAISVLNKRIGALPNVTIVHNNFSDIKNIVDNLGLDGIDGMLLDLGVSSFQLDNGDRGFSFHQNAPLDMRMSKNGLSAYDVVNSYDDQSLADVIWRYGEEKFSRSIAKNIVKSRADKPIETTFELVDIIKSSMPQRELKKGHPARKTFQAIRIEVNDELEKLSGQGAAPARKNFQSAFAATSLKANCRLNPKHRVKKNLPIIHVQGLPDFVHLKSINHI